MRRPKHYDRPGKRPGPPRTPTGGGSIVDQRAAQDAAEHMAYVRWVPTLDARTRPAHREFPVFDWPAIEPPIWPRKDWSFRVWPDGLYITPVYRGLFGCRTWRVDTLGL